MSNQSRRDFLKNMGITGAVGASAMGAGWPVVANTPAPFFKPPAQDDHTHMDESHADGVQMFLDNIGSDPRFWTNDLEYTMDGDVKVFELTCEQIQWQVDGGEPRNAFAYNGTVPGPTIRVTEGDRVRIHVNNQMDQSTAVHWHGLDVPFDQDGVPFLTQDPITPGTTFTYEFTVTNYGSHMYHSHHNSMEQVVGGLLGAFVVEPASKRDEPYYDSEYIFVLNDSILGFTINGKSFPFTQPMTAKLGEKIRIRFYNEGLMIHPMHLHGMPMRVFAKDGYNLPAPYLCDTLNIAPGERYDVIVEARALGLWAFHCHVLSHVEGRNGMFGMVTVLAISE
jgi:FtsP/CotA-like multicopper oxidase with cupredoxin domain